MYPPEYCLCALPFFCAQSQSAACVIANVCVCVRWDPQDDAGVSLFIFTNLPLEGAGGGWEGVGEGGVTLMRLSFV